MVALRFTVVGHAGLYARSGSTDLLVDPWLFGSCYWRSWWHFPPMHDVDDAWLTPRFVYLSHHHFDHFHYPSLRRIARSARVLVPRFGVDVMRDELHGLGFHHVHELAHGKPFALGDGLEVRAYQYGPDDTTLVVRHGATVVADLNDCKIRGAALRQIQRDVGAPTFMLKNYSAAQAYPGCYRARRPEDLAMISRDSYLVDFLGVAETLRPRYAVPFASMTCFLHPETFERNQDLVQPHHLREAFDRAPIVGTELVVMNPGDSWDETDGFSIDPDDPYAAWPDVLTTLRAEAQPAIERADAAEAERTLTFDTFRRYFDGFVHALPRPVRGFLKRPVVFAAPEGADGGRYWVIDVKGRRVYRTDELPDGWASVVRTPEGVLADAIANRIVNFVHISMRLQIELDDDGTGTDFMFWGLLTIWELGYLPLHELSMTRLAVTGWSRRREFLAIAWGQVAGKGSRAERIAGTLMPVRGDGPSDTTSAPRP
jgi:UDP-MurNAc hydroxylase